ncbi:MAG TPA: PP2C family protein-serine/threonine phosphatase [Acidimicrobiales bacterium]|nr:PP2C family protein-serine/threonine phosphatase [Acidimicrobiales bacterium]
MAGRGRSKGDGERFSAFIELLRRSHLIDPVGIQDAIAGAAKRMGWQLAGIFLADLEQRLLTRVGEPAFSELDEDLPIDTTMAGRAFVSGDVHLGKVDGTALVWVPMIDGTARIGVMGIFVPGDPVADNDALLALASLATLMVLAKSGYTDLFTAARRRKDMSLAAEMQWARLPPLTLGTPRVAVAAIVEPAYALGGDAFDYALNGDVLHLAILDAMGHGLESATAVSLAIGSLRHSRRRSLGLPDAYRAADRALSDQFGSERFVTAQIGQLDVNTGRLSWLSAGHPPPLLLRGSKIVGYLPCQPSLPLGLGGGVESVTTTDLEPWDRLLFFTDGVVEGRRRGEPFGEERLADTLARESLAGNGPAETLRRLSHAILDHEGHQLSDDFTLLLVEYRGSDADQAPDSIRVATQRTL